MNIKASANAGDTALYVRGAGINYQFGIEVNEMHRFQAFHTAVIKNNESPTKPPDSVEYYHHEKSPNGCKSTEGHIIISGFKDKIVLTVTLPTEPWFTLFHQKDPVLIVIKNFMTLFNKYQRIPSRPSVNIMQDRT